MPVKTPNALISLAGQQPKPVDAFLDAREQKARTERLDAGTEFTQQAAEKAAMEVKRLAEFESIVRGVNESQPLLDKITNSTNGSEFTESMLNMAGKLRDRAQNIGSTGGDNSDTLDILRKLENNDFEGIQSEFDRIKRIEQFRQMAEFGGAGAVQQLPSAVREFQMFEGLGDPENPDVLTPAQERFLQVKRASQQFATVAGQAGVVDTTTGTFDPLSTVEQEVDAASDLAEGKESGRQAAVTQAIPEQERARQEQIAKTTRIKAQSERRETAIALLPAAESRINEYSNLINEVINSPHLEPIIGFWQGRVDGLTGEQKGVLNIIEQLQGGAFLDAFQSLKGGGPITDTEGRAATAAKTRILDRTVDLPSYIDALRDLDASFLGGLEKLRNEASIDIDGDTATNQQTGEKIIFRDGEWVSQ